ncbi:sortase [Streptomyces sp. NPDC004435]|uniref:sortase n=1 Tax=Streptomyces sp. NPDC004435 TaxID=3364701 RepID=UPI0036C58189
MRLARTGAQLALVLSALALSAPHASAAPSGDVRVNPGLAAPGTTVTVTTTACGAETYGKGESVVAGPFHLFAGERPGVLVGTFTLPRDAAAGTDTLTLKCPPRIKQTVTYRISATPNGAVEAGFGWAAGPDAGTDEATGVTYGLAALGVAAAGLLVVRRRRVVAARSTV